MPKLLTIITLIPLRLALVSMLLLSTASCRTVSTEVVEHMLHDTLWQAHQQYDSICVLENHTEKYRPSSYHFDSLAHAYLKTDTLYRDRTKTEFRYKLLHDTTYIHRVDTVPRIVRVVETKNKTPVWWWVLVVGVGVVLLGRRAPLSS